MSKPSFHNAQNWLLLGLLTLIWGTSYILIKKGLIAFSPVQLACLRIGISGLCAFPIAVRAIKNVPKEKYFTLLLVGLFSSGVPAFLFALSITKSDSSVNGILNALSPMWTILIGYYMYHVIISKQKVTGVIIGFLGAVVLVLGKGLNNIKIDLAYGFLPLVATFCYGMGTNITKQKLQNDNPVSTTAVAMSMTGIPALIACFFTGAIPKIATGSAWPSMACIVALAIFSTLTAWVLFYKLLQRTDALFAASVTYLVPIVALAWGMLDGEVLTLMQLGGMALILIGVYYTTKTSTG